MTATQSKNQRIANLKDFFELSKTSMEIQFGRELTDEEFNIFKNGVIAGLGMAQRETQKSLKLEQIADTIEEEIL